MMKHFTRGGRGLVMAAALLGALASGCGSSDDGGESSGTYHATIRRTSFGVPNILAEDLPSAGFGIGYAAAEDYACILADQIVKVRSERSKYFGAGERDANLESDFGVLAARVYEAARAGFPKQSERTRELIDGYVAGYNLYLKKHADELPMECRGADWVKPISANDLLAYYYWLALLASLQPLLPYLSNAAPPNSALWMQPQGTVDELRQLFRPRDLGSNGWAIGKDKSEAGHGMLVANPHFPWEGNLKLWEFGVNVPGTIHAHGVGLLGVGAVLIGFNENLAWTHTVTTAQHFTLYQLRLVDGDPTSYLYDGKPRKMSSETVSVEVRGDDGSTSRASRTFWRSHYGPMLSLPVLGWTNAFAFSVRDANENNLGIVEQFLRTDMAESLDELDQINEEVHGIPWVNTMATDRHGTAYYADASRVPNVSDATMAAYDAAMTSDFPTQTAASLGVTMLDGSTSRDEWIETNGAPVVPFSKSPKLRRADFAFNANDSYWLANPAAPLEGFPRLFGSERTPRSPRTRMNAMMLTEQSADGASGADGKFSFDELSAVPFSDRASIAELLRDEVVARCTGASPVTVKGETIALAAACDALRSWDLRLDLDSVGAVVWREFLAALSNQLMDAGKLFANGFDAAHPVATPNGLTAAPASGDDPVLVALATAVSNLGKAGFAVTATLGELQHARKGELIIPIHGGNNLEGAFNIVGYNGESGTLLQSTSQPKTLSAADLTDDGYIINNGSSFVMVLEFTGDGPRARALLTYSESSDPDSPHFADQTQRFSEKQWRPVVFTEDEIAADPELQTVEISGAKR